jgi:predicted  nucleic acid-binding Zn-ribbon protein
MRQAKPAYVIAFGFMVLSVLGCVACGQHEKQQGALADQAKEAQETKLASQAGQAEKVRKAEQARQAEETGQAEETTEAIAKELGDEINADVGHISLSSDSLIQFNEYKIQNLRISINRNTGLLTIIFDCGFNGGRSSLTRILVRLFDANGQYITHFVTKEWFMAPNCLWFDYSPNGCQWEAQVNSFILIPLKQHSNVLQYRINLRDAAYVQNAEFGRYTGPAN